MPTAAEHHPRQVITGTTADGRSTIVSDSPAPARAAMPVCTVTDLYTPSRVPVDLSDLERAGQVALEPAPQGLIVRTVCFPPDSEWKGKASFADSLGDIGGKEATDGDASSGMHRTDTVDVIIILEGEIYSVTDEGETLLRAGDTLLQCGTAHAWSNRTDRPCTMVAVLIAADRDAGDGC